MNEYFELGRRHNEVKTVPKAKSLGTEKMILTWEIRNGHKQQKILKSTTFRRQRWLILLQCLSFWRKVDRGILGLFGKNVAASKYWFTNWNLWGPNTKKYKTATREKILHLGTQQIWRNDQETTPQGKRILLNYSFSFCISMFFFRPPCFCWGSPLHFIYMVVVFSWKERCLFSIQFQGAAPVTKWKVFVYSHLPRDQIHTM